MDKGKKILIVEDEVLIALALKKELNAEGYENCRFVTSGEKAIADVKNGPPDLLLMDINLGGKLNGFDTALRIREFADIPLVFMSGYEDAQIRQDIREFSRAYYLEKPVRLNDIMRIISKKL